MKQICVNQGRHNETNKFHVLKTGLVFFSIDIFNSIDISFYISSYLSNWSLLNIDSHITRWTSRSSLL